METTEHCFQTCVEVSKAWELYRNLRHKANLSRDPKNWEEILFGKALSTLAQTHKEEIPWGAEKAFTASSDTPWDMLRTNILWNIWTQRCKHNFSEEAFSLASALFNAWQTTIQIGMAAWYEVVKYRNVRGQRKQAQLEEVITNIWTEGNIFCEKGPLNTLRWKFTPDETFLPAGLAKEVAILTDLRRRRGRHSEPGRAEDARLTPGQQAYNSQNTGLEGEGGQARDQRHRGNGNESAQDPDSDRISATEDEGEAAHLADIQALLALTDLI